MRRTFAYSLFTRNTSALEARAVRAITESALERAGWPWSRRISLWLDVLLTIEESP